MDAADLARLQFALTIAFHFLFPPLTIGLAWIIFWIMNRYRKTGSEVYERMARFWIKVFAATFVVGVATGITMEFQFGTNWAQYSRFVGDIFGAPLAAEAVIAFFLESTFLAVLVLGWGRVSPKVHTFAALMVAVGSTLSAFWILVANSWQQTPAGYHIVNGRAELTSFSEAVLNPSTFPRFFHTIDGAFITAGFFMMGIAALLLLRGKQTELARGSLKVGLVVALAASLLQMPLGHIHSVQVAETQPAKLAAFEGLFNSQICAPMVAFCVIRPGGDKATHAIELPGLLSYFIYGDRNAKVTGLSDFPRDEWPPVATSFYSFHAMVLLGLYFIGLSGLGVIFWRRGTLFDNRSFLRLALFSIPLPFLANNIGWIAAEVGRQPWIVYKLLRTDDAISVTVPAGQILFTIIAFCLIYTLLFGAWLLVMKRHLSHELVADAILPEKEAVIA